MIALLLSLQAIVRAAAPAASSAVPDSTAARIHALFDQANQFWMHEFSSGGSYTPAQLTLFDHQIRSVCDEAGPLSGPFYCPADLRVYLDQDFVRQAARPASGIGGDFALGYLIGHELGLHIQNLVGTTDVVDEARSNSSPALSARIWMTAELQADCYSGLWMKWALTHGLVRPADAGAALEAVATVSEAWQKHLASGEVMVDPLLTYGTAEQRLQWFQRGLSSGRFNDCDTFSAEAAGRL